ncbi:MAG: sugar ABC transporter permease [Clostridiaceae bacterium]|nr:sugar ABC transporter permease [Clostridiaceae bacterium]
MQVKLKVNNGQPKSTLKSMKNLIIRERYWELYLMLVPSVLILIIFKYVPMNGLIIAFQQYNIFDGILKSPFIGMENFKELFNNQEFYTVFRNTLLINSYKLLFYIPIPVLLALFINDVKNAAVRKAIQTTIYLPHFLSWVIVGGIFVNVLAVNGGIVNNLIVALGGEPLKFMYDKSLFRGVLITSSIWKEAGWATVIYLAAIAGVDLQMYEAAVIDGASKIKQIWYITLPSISTTIILVLLMSLGNILTNSFEQILVMYNPSVYEVADVINTYVYRHGVGQMEYSYTTAVGLFNSVVGFALVMSTNSICRKYLDRSLW